MFAHYFYHWTVSTSYRKKPTIISYTINNNWASQILLCLKGCGSSISRKQFDLFRAIGTGQIIFDDLHFCSYYSDNDYTFILIICRYFIL